MTFREIVDARIQYSRLPEWASAKLRLHITADNHVGPWVTLRDPHAQTEDKILITQLLNDSEDRYMAASHGEPTT